jgi:large subunit ribosomal protein L28
MFERNKLTGLVTPIQNVPLPLKSVPEENEGIWGGEAIIQGFQKRDPCKRRVPHFWVPVLKRSVVRSDILNEFFPVTITDRTIEMIHESHGFDHYILKTPACDLRSTLALSMKRKMLQELEAGCPKLADDPQKQKTVLEEYKKYLDQYTSEEIEWYGLTFKEAIYKIKKKVEDEDVVIPHKILMRSKLIEQLKEAGIQEVSDNVAASHANQSSWMSKLNPFGRKKET